MGVWKQIQVTAGSTISNAYAGKDWLTSIIPNGITFAYIINDETDKTNWANNQLVVAFINSGEPSVYIRYRDNNYNMSSVWGLNYDLTIEQGETYTILYQ